MLPQLARVFVPSPVVPLVVRFVILDPESVQSAPVQSKKQLFRIASGVHVSVFSFMPRRRETPEDMRMLFLMLGALLRIWIAEAVSPAPPSIVLLNKSIGL